MAGKNSPSGTKKRRVAFERLETGACDVQFILYGPAYSIAFYEKLSFATFTFSKKPPEPRELYPTLSAAALHSALDGTHSGRTLSRQTQALTLSQPV